MMWEWGEGGIHNKNTVCERSPLVSNYTHVSAHEERYEGLVTWRPMALPWYGKIQGDLHFLLYSCLYCLNSSQ